MPDNVNDSPTPTPEAESIDAMVARARSGDREVLPRLRAYLDAHPEAWRHGGDLASHAMEMWIGLIAGPDLAAGESLARKAAELGSELAGPSPSPLERLLAGRVVACWLQVHYCDASVAHSVDLSLRQAALSLRRQDMAHRRYLQAIAALAMVRRLMPAAAEPGGFGSPLDVTAGLSDEVAEEPGSRDGDGITNPGRPAPLIVFDPVAGLGQVAGSREAVASAC